MIRLFHGDYRDHLDAIPSVECVFVDPPDNIKLGYDGFDDNLAKSEYKAFLRALLWKACDKAPIVWISFNSRWSAAMGKFIEDYVEGNAGWEEQHCVQVFTFGQHNKHGLGNNHRPLWLLNRVGATFYPDAIRVPSARQTKYNDKRANPAGRVPGDVFDMQYPIHSGDTFDFPRVTGNSKARSDWHPTQLHPELVKRCIAFSTLPGDSAADFFAGTGTTAKVCRELGVDCYTCEYSDEYVPHLVEDLALKQTSERVYDGA
jgi:DNA modification methylase